MADTIKYLLSEEQIPKSWYNIMADLPSPPPPPLHPGTLFRSRSARTIWRRFSR